MYVVEPNHTGAIAPVSAVHQIIILLGIPEELRSVIMCNVYILLRFEDGYLFEIEKEVYDGDFEADELIRKHGNIVRFHLCVET